jgi:hypothetical protein
LQCDIYGFPTNETAFVGSLTAATQSPWLEGAAGTNLAEQGISVSCVEGGTNGEIYFEVPSNVGFVVSLSGNRAIECQKLASDATRPARARAVEWEQVPAASYMHLTTVQDMTTGNLTMGPIERIYEKTTAVGHGDYFFSIMTYPNGSNPTTAEPTQIVNVSANENGGMASSTRPDLRFFRWCGNGPARVQYTYCSVSCGSRRPTSICRSHCSLLSYTTSDFAC